MTHDTTPFRDMPFRMFFESAADAHFLHDAQGRFLDVNQAACDSLGYSRDALLALGVEDVVGGVTREDLEGMWASSADGHTSIVTGRHRRKDGTIFPVEVRITAFRFQGQLVVFAAAHDITNRMQSEAAVRQNERRLSLAISATADAIWEWDLLTNDTYYSPRWYEMLGYAQGQFPMTFETWKALCHPDDLPAAIERVQACLANPESTYLAEFRMRARNGSWIWIQGRGNVVSRDASGKPLIMCGTNTDISERKRLANDRDLLFNLSLDLLAIVGFDGMLRQVNPAWGRTLGWSDEELLSKPRMRLIHPSDQNATATVIEKLMAGQPVLGYINRYRCLDGSYRVISWNSFPLVSEQVILAVGRDLTDSLKAEERLRHADKMNAIGQLAGGVAHDFNNQLGGIMGHAELLLRRLEHPEQRRYAERIIKAVERSADLTGKLLAFARKGRYVSVGVDLHALISETVDILARSIDRRIRIEKVLRAKTATVSGDQSQLQNALLNLGLNARDAMTNGGILRFATDVTILSQGERATHGLDQPGGAFVSLQISDTGIGMSDHVKAHLFEPFFTTKDPGKGTGMGLAAVYGTVVNHKGTISISSTPGHGTTVTIILPLAKQDAQAVSVSEAVPSLTALRILIVDDEQELRESLAENLRDHGHEVRQSANGKEAVTLYRDAWQDIDIVILDMVMPEMNGRDCFTALKKINPGIRALLASGFSFQGEAPAILGDGVLGFIQKPFKLSELLESIASATSSPNGA
jgi:PAS domain S-box-containing protein